MFDPKTDKYPYPDTTDEHYIKMKTNNGAVFDENYPYIDKSKSFKFKRFWVRMGLFFIVFPWTRVHMGLKIKGKKNLKIHKQELKDGFVNVSNHVHFWDYIAIMKALRPRKPNVLVWGPNIRDSSGGLVRLVGGIPIPDTDDKAKQVFRDAIKRLLSEDKGILQVYAEGSMWEYYQPIRPFKLGAAHFAIQNNKPILPMGFSYREPSWFRRTILKQPAALTLNIGEPIYKDDSLMGKQQVLDLITRARDAICVLVGIEPNKNIYPSIFHDSKKIDY